MQSGRGEKLRTFLMVFQTTVPAISRSTPQPLVMGAIDFLFGVKLVKAEFLSLVSKYF